jgi:hypothetical protein
VSLTFRTFSCVEDEEIDDVDDTDTEVGAKVTAEESRSLDDLLGELGVPIIFNYHG